MDDLQESQHTHRRGIYGRRLLKHAGVDTPLYDASEEDNDGKGDEGSSFTSPHATRHGQRSTSDPRIAPDNNGHPLARPPIHGIDGHTGPSSGQQSQKNHTESSAYDRADSPTYDGDIESSATGNRSQHGMSSNTITSLNSNLTQGHTIDAPSDDSVISSITSRKGSKRSSSTTSASEARDLLSSSHKLLPTSLPPLGHEPDPPKLAGDSQGPPVLTVDDIQAFVQSAINPKSDSPRAYRPNPPPQGRPIRIYADGVYDIFHFGHALQLRQAKLSFPSVHLMVGVCSDELCVEHKSRTVMNHAERCESVRHCRWVDEIIPDAPWVIDQGFIDKYQIDYVAHDDDPYKGSDGSDDVYHYPKSIGHFIPTRRTAGVSTSELLERIVAGYREGDWDSKLVKIGHPELTSRAPSRAASSRPESRAEALHPLDSLRVDHTK